jgi:hypothetical protein
MDWQTVAVLLAGFTLGEVVSGWQWGERSSAAHVREIAEQVGKVLQIIAKPSARKPRARRR